MKTVGTERKLSPAQITGGCGHCGLQWGSITLAHCKGNSRHSGCGETFSSDSAFALHRRRGVCKSPASLRAKETGVPLLQWDEVKQWWEFPGDRPDL